VDEMGRGLGAFFEMGASKNFQKLPKFIKVLQIILDF
jgi:hypothetical protein